MRVFIAGVDGYLGWSLAMYLIKRGHEIAGADCYHRRDWVAEMGSQSATPIRRMTDRLQAFRENFGTNLQFIRGDITDYNFVWNFFRAFEPEVIVHLAEMPSAPYSMIDVHHCTFTHSNNLLGTINILHTMRDICPDAHLVKLGTMGEYGTPSIDIPEGFFEIEYRGRKDTLPFPKQAGSWYHQTKVHDTNNITMACRIWGLRSTDIMQGVVFGTQIDEMGDDERLLTRFDLRDSMQCMTIAIENPPQKGEYRVFNQFEEVYDLTELALKVQKVADRLGLKVEVRNVENPRMELEEHYYNPDHQHLLDLGYEPTHDIEAEMEIMLKDLQKYQHRVEARAHALIPDIRWDGSRRKVSYL
jgi:UDP-sulfoquinovose synthase